MKTHIERLAAAAEERKRIADAYEDAKSEARALLSAAHEACEADTAALAERISREDNEARAAVHALGDERLLPLLVSLNDEATNKVAAALLEAIEALDVAALAATGELFPLRRFMLLLAEIHRQKRPAILEHIGYARAWHANGEIGGPEAGDAMRKAVKHRDVAGVRAAFERLDARLWSLSLKPIDPETLATWQATIHPDPAVLQARLADVAKREREAMFAAHAAAGPGGAKLGMPETRGVTYSR